MKRVLQIAGLGIAIIGVVQLVQPTDSSADLIDNSTTLSTSDNGHHLHASKPKVKRPTTPSRAPSQTAQTDGRNPARDYQLPPHKGVAFLEELYNGQPLRVAQDLGINKRGAMGFDITKRDAISSLGACAHWIVSCVDPKERSLDQCVAAAPTCESDQPWENEEHTFCCPAACADNYATARTNSQSAIEAFTMTYYTNPTCFPAAVELLESGPSTPTVPQ